MADQLALSRLNTWFSPAFPTGGFAWSGGLEAACAKGLVMDKSTLLAWVETALTLGSAKADGILLASAWKGEEPSEIAASLAPSPERWQETIEQGNAFLEAAKPWLTGENPPPGPLPILVGVITRKCGIDLHDALTAFLNAFIIQQVQAGQRLIPLGQAQAMEILAQIEGTLSKTVTDIATSTLDDLGTATPIMDLCAMQHATLPTRIFRS